MKIEDILWFSYRQLKEKKLRTSLTIVMVVIGVASIVALTSLTAGVGASVSSDLAALGPTTIIVSSTGTGVGFTAASVSLLSSLPNVSSVTPLVEGEVTAYANGQNTTATLVGIPSEDLSQLIGTINLYQGTLYQDTLSPSAVIGYSIAFPTTLGGTQSVSVGQPLTLKLSAAKGSSSTITVPVVGILQQYGTTTISVDTAIIVSLQEAEALLHKTSYSSIIVKANNISSVSSVSNTITDVYGSSVRVETTQEILATVNSVLGSITALLLVIAGISLLVAAIGIMNVMLISVVERTHEIGIMKSVGFRSRQVMTIFLFQALLIGAVGGVLGIAVGAGASYSLAALFTSSSSSSSSASTGGTSTTASSSSGFRGGGGSSGFGGGGAAPAGGVALGGGPGASSSSSSSSFEPVITLTTIILALAVAVGVSVLAGLYPAWRASKMEPIDALRQL